MPFAILAGLLVTGGSLAGLVLWGRNRAKAGNTTGNASPFPDPPPRITNREEPS